METYSLEENETIINLPAKKSDLFALFSDKKDELKNYKKEKLKVKKTKDLVKLLVKYNALKNMDTSPSRSLLGNRAQNN